MADSTDDATAAVEFPDIAAMTDKAELLAAVSEVHVPNASIWPAMGWWLLGLLLIAAALIFWLHKRSVRQKAANAWRREALAEVSAMRQALPKASDVERHTLVRDCSALLRRVMMHVDGRTDTASLTENDWLAALNAHATARALNVKLQPLLTEAPYETAPSDLATRKNVKALLKWMTQYIENLPQHSSAAVAKAVVSGGAL